MALVKCPECGAIISDAAGSCPKCGYKKKSSVGCFGCIKWLMISAFIVVVLFMVVATCDNSGETKNEPSIVNYNDNSVYHQILAKNYFKDHLKKSMKDPGSYHEISYTSTYNHYRKCYVVDLKFRAKNSFGAYTIERWTCDVTFDGKIVRFENMYQLE